MQEDERRMVSVQGAKEREREKVDKKKRRYVCKSVTVRVIESDKVVLFRVQSDWIDVHKVFSLRISIDTQ